MAHELLTLLASAVSAAGASDETMLAAPVKLTAGGVAIDTNDHVGHSGPLYADYDGDGLSDLLVGNFAGHIQLYKNVGTKEAPEFESKGLLEAEGEVVKVKNW